MVEELVMVKTDTPGTLEERLREAAANERVYAQEQDFWHEEILTEAADEIASLRARVEAMREALDDGMDQLHWINAQAENAMATSAGAATTSGDSDGSLQMLNSIASDIGVNAMMLHDKLAIARQALKDTPDAE